MIEQTELFVLPLPRTTAIYENRLYDKLAVEALLDLPEHGNSSTLFLTSKGTLFARGYDRVVYGDHGPYVEFDRKDIAISIHPVSPRIPEATWFYVWLVPDDGSQVKVYDQLRTVHNLPNPPAGGYRGNRKEGYADYRIGKLYVSPWEFGRIVE